MSLRGERIWKGMERGLMLRAGILESSSEQDHRAAELRELPKLHELRISSQVKDPLSGAGKRLISSQQGRVPIKAKSPENSKSSDSDET